MNTADRQPRAPLAKRETLFAVIQATRAIPAVELDRAIGQKEVKPVKNEVKKTFNLCLVSPSSHGVNHIDFLREQYLIHLKQNFWFVLQIRVHDSHTFPGCKKQTGRNRTLMAK